MSCMCGKYSYTCRKHASCIFKVQAKNEVKKSDMEFAKTYQHCMVIFCLEDVSSDSIDQLEH